MKQFYTVLLFFCFAFPPLSGAQNVLKTEPHMLVFKVKPASASSLARHASSNPLKEALKKVASLPAQQKFPRSAPDARTRSMVKSAVDLSLIYEVRYTPTQTFDQVKKELMQTGQVEYVEPLYVYEPLHTPNDPLAHPVTGSQEYLAKIKAFEAWNISKGDTNVVIGILDTGVRLTHEDLKDNLKYNYNDPIDGIDNDGDGYIDNFYGWDLADNDNNPVANANGHGTLVTGVASAKADNEKGIAGVGFNSKFLPIKVFASTPAGSFRGYEGIVYAADQGCKVINLSWGGVGFPSAFEQDVINYAAINKNVVIVSAAGNTNLELDFYPASYQNVLSVGSVTNEDLKSPNHTFSHSISLVAQGSGVFTTGNANDAHYGHGSGSSYATPMVSGAAALVRSHFPDLTALQVAERLRVTADDIYHLPENGPYLEKLGSGRLNVLRALTEEAPKSVRLLTWQIENGLVGLPGEVLELSAVFKNFLSPVTSLAISISSSSPYLEIQQNLFPAGSMATLAEKSNHSNPYKLLVSQNIPTNTEAVIRIGFTDGDYADYQYIKLRLNPDFVTTNVNNVAMSVFSRGNVAYDGMNMQIGQGFKYLNSNPVLAEGGLLIGYGPNQVSDNVRNEKGTSDKDFYAITNLVRQPNPLVADFEASNLMQDSLTSTKTKSMQIQQKVFAWAEEPYKDFVIMEYVLTNRTTQPITQAFAGIYADWDVFSASRNVTEWNNNLQLGLIRHVSDTSIWVGIQLLSDRPAGFYGLENSTIRENVINIADGFTSEEKYDALSGGVRRQNAGNSVQGSDVSYTISAEILPLLPEEKDSIAFAFVAGRTRADLYRHGAAAKVKYQELLSNRLLSNKKSLDAAQGIGLYPNPSSGLFSIRLPQELRSTKVEIQVVDGKGKLVKGASFTHKEDIDLNLTSLSNGLYLVRILAQGQTAVKRLVIAR